MMKAPQACLRIPDIDASGAAFKLTFVIRYRALHVRPITQVQYAGFK